MTSRFRLALALAVLAAFTVAAQADDIKPPMAKIFPHVDTTHGDVRVDNYYWLRDRENPEVIQYLEAENAYTATVLQHTTALQEKLYNEYLSRIKETDLEVPDREDDYFYYSRTEKGKDYPIYCRKHGSLESKEEIILDENLLAEGKKFMSLGVMATSPDHHLLAYSTDTLGNEEMVIQVKDLRTGKLLAEAIPNTAYDFAWGNDNKTFFYTVLDAASRPYKVFRHTLGDDPAKDVEVFTEPDELFYVGLSKTKDEKYILINVGSIKSSEVRVLDADNPIGEFRIVQPRTKDLEYTVEHHDNRFLIVTNDNALNFKVMAAPESTPSRENWQDFVPYNDTIYVTGIEVFKDHLAIFERSGGLEKIRILNLADGSFSYVNPPEEVYTIGDGTNHEFNSTTLRFSYASMVTPSTVVDYDMTNGKWEIKKQQEVLGGYDPKNYETKRIFATASDGVKVPISLVYRKGLVTNGKNPTVLYGYGAYGLSSDPYFSSSRVSLLDRGFIWAVAHIRGGSEMGRQWYEDGKAFHKKNTFTDFIACGEELIKQGYTSKEEMAILGGSAGGLLIGAVVNMRPDLFKAAIAAHPFVDVMNTMLDPTIPLTVPEYEEWGNPNDSADYFYMKSYSPYDNVAPITYPQVLIIGGLNDPRVAYWEPAKLAAKLRATKTDENRLLLRTTMESGHFGASGRYGSLKEIALEHAFILDAFNIKD